MSLLSCFSLWSLRSQWSNHMYSADEAHRLSIDRFRGHVGDHLGYENVDDEGSNMVSHTFRLCATHEWAHISVCGWSGVEPLPPASINTLSEKFGWSQKFSFLLSFLSNDCIFILHTSPWCPFCSLWSTKWQNTLARKQFIIRKVLRPGYASSRWRLG